MGDKLAMTINRTLFNELETVIEDELEVLHRNLDPEDPDPVIKLRINRLDSALQRMVDGSYGLCKKCGEEIDEDRLRANPIALLCAQCGHHERPPESLVEKLLAAELEDTEGDDDLDDDYYDDD
jgi:RNA polymerase-binding transcription factor DksA